MTEHDLDVLIAGAGLSGIDAAYRVKTECPGRRFAVLEARECIGGTWDLFRYPGVRSDSDMFTLGYPFHPWKDAKAIADGPSILAYIRETAHRFGLEPHIRLRHRIVAARWSSDEARWTLDVEVGPERTPERFRCRFLYLCSGYYSYEQAHAPKFAGTERFAGRIVHPQWWPEDLDWSDQRVVVIGSGATAITLVPALAEQAAHVTMLQRSPTWIVSLPGEDRIADRVRGALPAGLAHRLLRAKNVLLATAFYQFCRRFPKTAGRLIKRGAARHLPEGYPIDPHFSPRYDPWDQRLCVVPDGDLFDAIADGRAEVVTDTIETFTEHGLRLTSGRELEADLVVTATGLRLRLCGGIQAQVDGTPVVPGDTLVYKGVMLSGVPNLAVCVGYINASWTLRADLSSRYVCRLLNYMDRHRYDVACPRAATPDAERRPLLDLSSGYVLRAADGLPKQGAHSPWHIRQNYLLDLPTMTLGPVDDPAMVFSRRASPAPLADPSATPVNTG